ncbi:MAG: glycosyltransferase [Thiocapsa sp.]|nr:CmcI family methyltransferase [Thiocapsa sp.]MCG6984522.1 glycosyltransferase [Thiocapsa sp.]
MTQTRSDSFDFIDLGPRPGTDDPAITVIIAAYAMERELPRTLMSLSRSYQNATESLHYDVLLVDNGSPNRPNIDQLKQICPNLSGALIRKSPGRSPVAGLNGAIQQARGSIVGVMIDAARILSPGIIASAAEIITPESQTVVGTYGFHLGPDVQMESVKHGYGPELEDKLLEQIGFPAEGYRLFEISSLAGSSSRGWYSRISESNLFFTTKRNLLRLGGFDERFASEGGGFANLEIWDRLVSDPLDQVVMLLGEGTFHQVHGGTATNRGSEEKHVLWRNEYAAITGRDYRCPSYRFMNDGAIESSDLMRRFTDTTRPSSIGLPGVIFSEAQLTAIQNGVMNRSFYRRVPFFKSPFCQAIYGKLISDLRPGSVIEIGSHSGGSALFFADRMAAEGLVPNLLCIDILDRMAPLAKRSPEIRFIQLSAEHLGRIYDIVDQLPKPWLVVEDADHTFQLCVTVFESFRTLLTPGDMYVVEDGIVAYLGEAYRRYDSGPLRAIEYILANYGDRFAIDRDSCDLYGLNATWSPNGFLRVI